MLEKKSRWMLKGEKRGFWLLKPALKSPSRLVPGAVATVGTAGEVWGPRCSPGCRLFQHPNSHRARVLRVGVGFGTGRGGRHGPALAVGRREDVPKGAGARFVEPILGYRVPAQIWGVLG